MSSNEKSATGDQQDDDSLDARRATGIVKALASGGDEITCSDCGEKVDVSEADSELQVIAVLANHKEQSHD